MKHPLLLLFAVFLTTAAFARQTSIDSLQSLLISTSDTSRANVLMELSKTFTGVDQKKAVSYAEQARDVFRAYNHPKGEAYALKSIGSAYFIEGDYTETLEHWQHSLQVFISIGDKVGESNMLNNIGVVYSIKGWELKAIEFYLQSLKAAEESGDKLRLATVLVNLGNEYALKPATYNKALEYNLKALPLIKEIGDLPALGTVTVNLGEIYNKQGQLKKAHAYYQEALSILKSTGEKDRIAYTLNCLGKLEASNDHLDQAMEYHQQALTAAREGMAKLEITQSLIGIGNIYQKKEQLQQALIFFKEARELALELGAQHELKDIYQGMAQVYNLQGDPQKAFDHQLLLQAVKDTLYNTETNKKIVNLQANYESEQQRAQIDLLTKDKALQKSTLQRQTLVRNALLAGLLLILVLAFVLFRNYQNKAMANRLLRHKNHEINEQKEELASQRDYLEQTYNNLLNTQSQLVQSEKMASLGQLTAGVAHEINNPINFVSAGIDSLRSNFSDIMEVMQEYLDLDPETDNQQKLKKLQRLKDQAEVEELIEESNQLFKSIKNGAVRTTEIVKSLKNFTRLDESHLKKADIHEGIDSTLVILGSQIRDKINLVKEYGKLPLITCYPGQLNQVFMNILSNAVQAIKEEGMISIRTYKMKEWAVVSIRDTGVGMSEEVKKHIFDPFYTTKDVGEGTGLGLSISYGIIEKHKGKIEVESTEGVGTEFKIYISLQLSDEVASGAEPATQVEAVSTH